MYRCLVNSHKLQLYARAPPVGAPQPGPQPHSALGRNSSAFNVVLIHIYCIHTYVARAYGCHVWTMRIVSKRSARFTETIWMCYLDKSVIRSPSRWGGNKEEINQHKDLICLNVKFRLSKKNRSNCNGISDSWQISLLCSCTRLRGIFYFIFLKSCARDAETPETHMIIQSSFTLTHSYCISI